MLLVCLFLVFKDKQIVIPAMLRSFEKAIKQWSGEHIPYWTYLHH